MPFALFLFAISILLLFLLLVGYPVIIFVLAKVYPRKILKEDYYSRLTMIIPCYNECYMIKSKIENTFSLDFPQGQLEVIVVDSCSKDGTTEILNDVSDKYPFKTLHQSEREGKVSAINEALKIASGEIIFLTDTDTLLTRDAIKAIVRNFADPNVGAVVAKYKMQGKSMLSKSVGVLFSVFREKIRHYESIVDSSSYFTGELLAFRKALMEKIDEDTTADDQFILLDIRRQGYRCVTEPDCVVSEYIPTQTTDTLEHRRRTMYGTLQVSTKYKDLLFKRKYGLFGFLIFPFSLVRIILLPWAVFFVEISFLYLLFSTSLFVFSTVLLCLLVASLAFFAFKKEALAVMFSIPILQVAMILGTIDFLVGNSNHVVWRRLKKS